MFFIATSSGKIYFQLSAPLTKTLDYFSETITSKEQLVVNLHWYRLFNQYEQVLQPFLLPAGLFYFCISVVSLNVFTSRIFFVLIS